MAEPDSTPHEYIDAGMAIEGLAGPTDEKRLLDALAGHEGLRSAELDGKMLILEYEPVFIHKTQIVALVIGAGFRIGEVETASASPMLDALNEEPTSGA